MGLVCGIINIPAKTIFTQKQTLSSWKNFLDENKRSEFLSRKFYPGSVIAIFVKIQITAVKVLLDFSLIMGKGDKTITVFTDPR